MYELIKKQLEEFDDEVNQLRRLSVKNVDENDNGESEIVKFGYKIQRKDELFSVVDFGNIKSFIKSHSIQLLEKEIEWLRFEKKKIYDNWSSTNDRDDERFTKLTKEDNGFNRAVNFQISHLKAEINKIKKLSL